MQVTPLQMANLAAIFANKGFYYKPHLVKNINGIKILFLRNIKTEWGGNRCKAFWFDSRSYAAALYGTAKPSDNERLGHCWKNRNCTKSAWWDHSVFIAFCPARRSKIAIAVYIENAGWGGRAAASTASLMIEKYIQGEVKRLDLENYVLAGNFIYWWEEKRILI